MSKLEAQNKELARLINQYYDTGQFAQEILTHLESVRSYTSNLPNFKSYTGIYKEEMELAAHDKAINAIISGKYERNKRNPISYFGNIYYNAYVECLKRRAVRERHKETIEEYSNAVLTPPPITNEDKDPVALFSPYMSWILSGRDISARFIVFIADQYPELLPLEMIPKENQINNYNQTFPNRLKPTSKTNISKLMAKITELRRIINSQNDVRDKGLQNNMKGLIRITQRRLKE